MKFGSVCSGIEAASMAWRPLGWQCQFVSEIDAFPCAVLNHHYPAVPNHGDMTNFKDWPDADINVLCGGTPCQSYSIAGLRAGLDDPRGDLMLTFGGVAARYRPKWLVWDNVPGVLSSGGGRDFGAFLGLLAFIGYGFAYRVLDAQYIRVDTHGRAVPQRRNRVFVVGCLGDWRGAAAVLLERESLRGDPAPRRSAGARVAATLTRGAESSGRGGYAGRRQEDDANIVTVGATLRANSGRNQIEATYVAHALTAQGYDASEDGTGRGTPLISMCLNAGGGGRLDGESETLIPTTGVVFVVANTITAQVGEQTGTDARNGNLIAFDTTQITSAHNRSNPQEGDTRHPLAAQAHAPAIAFNARQTPVNGDVPGPLDTLAHTQAVMDQKCVRRLTPLECERLMGFPDGYTAINWKRKPAKDGPRYKALGNSWAVNVAHWIGRRIDLVEGIHRSMTT